MAINLSLADKKYLLLLNMEAGLSFEAAARSAQCSDRDTQELRRDRAFMDSLPKETSLATLMHNCLKDIEAGASLRGALIIEGATEQQATFMSESPGFMAKVQQIEEKRNFANVRLHEAVKQTNTERGVSTELRWEMGKKDPDWADKTTVLSATIQELPSPNFRQK